MYLHSVFSFESFNKILGGAFHLANKVYFAITCSMFKVI